MQWQEFKKFVISRVDLLILIVCLMVTYGAWQVGIARDTTQQDYMKDLKVKVERELKVDMENLLRQINDVRGLYVSSDSVDPKELSYFMKITGSLGENNALLRIGFIQKVDSTEEKDFENEMRLEGNAEYKSVPNPNYDSQFYVAKTVDTKGNIYVPSGRNLLNDPASANLIARIVATKTGQVMYMSTVANIEGYSGPVFVGSLPVYKNDELIGLINGIVSVEAVKERISEIVGNDVTWKWSITDGSVLGEGGVVVKGKMITDTAELTIFPEVKWKIELSKSSTPTGALNVVFGIGVLISFLIYAMVYALSSANVRAEKLAHDMTVDLKKYKLALDSANNHIVITDVDGVILYANYEAQKLTGFSLSEMFGNTPRLWGGQMGEDFYDKFWKAIKEDKKVFSGIFINKRKNGELYNAQAKVSPIIGESGELIGFVGVEEDVTEENKNLKEKEATLAKLAKFNELMVGREMKMVELKKSLQEAQDKLNEK